MKLSLMQTGVIGCRYGSRVGWRISAAICTFVI